MKRLAQLWLAASMLAGFLFLPVLRLLASLSRSSDIRRADRLSAHISIYFGPE